MFDQLSKESISEIIDIELKDFYKRIEKLGFKLTLADEAKTFIADKGYDRNFGARPLKRAIQKYLKDELAELMLTLNADGKFGGTIEVTHNERDDKLTIKYEDIV